MKSSGAFPAIAAAALLVAVGVLVAAFAIDWHWLVCDVGHYETVHVAESEYPFVTYIGDVPITQWITTPAHDEQHWVCDHPKGSR